MKNRAFLLLLLLPAAALAKVPFQGGLTSQQRVNVQGFGRKVVVPTYLPAGYHLSQVKVSGQTGFDKECDLVYSGPTGANFTIQESTGGIGDGPDGDRQYAYHSPLFGSGKLHWHQVDRSVWCGWLKPNLDQGPFYSLVGNKIAPIEAVHVVESLRYLAR